MLAPLTLVEVLAKIPDPRRRRGIRHPLRAILSLTVLAMLLGVTMLGWLLWQFLVHPRLHRSALQTARQTHSRAAAFASPAGPADAPFTS